MQQLPLTIHEIRAQAVVRQACVLELRSLGLTQVEIAAEVKITQARVSQILSKNKQKGRKRAPKLRQLRPRFAGDSHDGYSA